MLLRSFVAHQGIAAQRARLITFRPTLYLSYRASASSAAQEPSTVSNPEHTFSAVNIRQSTKTFSGKRWTILSIPKDGSNVTRWSQNERNGDQNLSVKQAILLTRDNMLCTFLPRGYPHSVTPEYKGFAYWQMWHNMAGSVTSVLSMQSMLYAIGLGAGSIPLAASINWILKDGLGQLGGVLYASAISDKFDSEPRWYRFKGTLVMQAASLVELFTPLFPGAFLALASISNIGKNMAWLATSASRAHIHRTFCLRNNLGDITGKSGSQATAAGLAGTGIGVLISAGITVMSPGLVESQQLLAPMFAAWLPFSALSIFAVYRSNRYAANRSLNSVRAEMVIREYFEQKDLSTPRQVAETESFIQRNPSRFKIPIRVEPLLEEQDGAEAWNSLDVESFLRRRYVVISHEDYVTVHFDQEASSQDILKGFYHACVARWGLERHHQYRDIQHTVDRTYSPFITQLKNTGWDVDSQFITDGDSKRIMLETSQT
ncbi:vitamin B6 photo-protection and homoeostasis-domain-containing protein [Umbelopsis sp. AD052]|nr:vitamin B6 photo-protection and homoeostasis-domain-containing protein [Umbelopsis sp. AD052]